MTKPGAPRVPYDKERYAKDPAYQARIKAVRKAWEKVNRPAINARRRRLRATNPRIAQAERNKGLQLRYGITSNDYDAMAARQDGLCALCGRRLIGRLCVDHCHDTRMLRLLLCHKCNRGFGSFDHNPDLMRRGADYLEIWRIIHARKLAAGFKPIPIRTSKPKKRKDTRCLPTSSPMKNPKPRV
jgi:hypothetical protein